MNHQATRIITPDFCLRVSDSVSVPFGSGSTPSALFPKSLLSLPLVPRPAQATTTAEHLNVASSPPPASIATPSPPLAAAQHVPAADGQWLASFPHPSSIDFDFDSFHQSFSSPPPHQPPTQLVAPPPTSFPGLAAPFTLDRFLANPAAEDSSKCPSTKAGTTEPDALFNWALDVACGADPIQQWTFITSTSAPPSPVPSLELCAAISGRALSKSPSPFDFGAAPPADATLVVSPSSWSSATSSAAAAPLQSPPPMSLDALDQLFLDATANVVAAPAPAAPATSAPAFIIPVHNDSALPDHIVVSPAAVSTKLDAPATTHLTLDAILGSASSMPALDLPPPATLSSSANPTPTRKRKASAACLPDHPSPPRPADPAQAKRLTNALSARRSRARKQAKLEYLERHVGELEDVNARLKRQVDLLRRKVDEGNKLAAQGHEHLDVFGGCRDG
ncbi:hypothetical protein BCR44DRAFT_1201051 [Catenaria anguillulae PL171]|uniref:BZIP domain-containing protein n=1 Tax=Catenaria anguillulae PL171 TaxID=765915 RepID=A0A1Y2HFM4_9FUNG|nr:hypothetical protein BCR44DRAFT_1201051 [Catenaria anguillulae PL171]